MLKVLGIFVITSSLLVIGCQKTGSINGNLNPSGNSPSSEPPNSGSGGVVPGCPSATPMCPTGEGTCAYANWDETSLTDPSVPGPILFNIYYGTSSGVYSTEITAVNGTCYQITGMSPGTYYFVATAYNLNGESPYSSEVSLPIQVSLSQLKANPSLHVSSESFFIVSGNQK
jgi:hypothetical protein